MPETSLKRNSGTMANREENPANMESPDPGPAGLEPWAHRVEAKTNTTRGQSH